MLGLFSTGVWWEYRSIHSPLRGDSRPARTRPGIVFPACAHLHTSWNNELPENPPHPWGQLAKQKLCLYSDMQRSSTDQLGKGKLQINKGALKGRKSCQSWREEDGVINHSTRSLSLSLLLDRLSTLLKIYRHCHRDNVESNNFSHQYCQDFTTFNCNFFLSLNEIFRIELWYEYILDNFLS